MREKNNKDLSYNFRYGSTTNEHMKIVGDYLELQGEKNNISDCVRFSLKKAAQIIKKKNILK